MTERKFTTRPPKPSANKSGAGSSPRAVVYLHVNYGIGPTRQQQRIVAQQHICQQRANELGATVVAEYLDYSSGTDIETRLEFNAMITKLKELQTDGNASPVYVIAATHSSVAALPSTYMRAAWRIQKTGAVLVIASISLAEYGAMGCDFLGVSTREQPHE